MLSSLFCRIIVVVLAVACAEVKLIGQAPVPAPYAGAVVTDWTGTVQLQLPGKSFTKLGRGEILPPGTIIATGEGRVLLTMRSDESQILVRPQTRIVLEEPSSANWRSLEVLLGRIRAYIQKQTGGAPPFQLGTPSAVVAVRGTRFDIEVNQRGITEVDVFDGLVEVSGLGIQGKAVFVNPGFSTRVAVGGEPEAPMPTREVRPDVQPLDVRLERKISRDKQMALRRSLENEHVEQPDTELNELQDESRESRERKPR
jgi:hypothetical protein